MFGKSRVHMSDGFHQVMPRGNGGHEIFPDPQDGHQFQERRIHPNPARARGTIRRPETKPRRPSSVLAVLSLLAISAIWPGAPAAGAEAPNVAMDDEHIVFWYPAGWGAFAGQSLEVAQDDSPPADGQPGPTAAADEIRALESLPTLEDRELGDPVRDEAGDIPQWDRALPFLAQKVIDLGFELPEPYGAAIIPVWTRQDLILDDLSISVNGGPMTAITFVDFVDPSVESISAQFKLDAWLFPFMNVYAAVGYVDGVSTIPLSIAVEDLLPSICSGAPRPPSCDQTLSAVAEAEFEGTNFSLGTNLAMGWSRYFFVLPITYTWSNINIVNNRIESLTVSPRIGVTRDVGELGTFAAYGGATYLDADVDITGSVTFDTSGIIGGSTTIDYEINQRNKDKWNLLLGFNWDVNRRWMLQAEVGFGGSRDQFISSATYRF
jgi:hypothetical protein